MVDNDGKGDICEEDADGDNIVDFVDNCPNNSKIYATDFRWLWIPMYSMSSIYQIVVMDLLVFHV